MLNRKYNYMYLNRTAFSFVILLVVFTLGCSTQKELSTFRISGQIINPREGKVVLTQEEDINRKKSKFVDTLNIDSNGKFDMSFNLEPHIYTLDFYGEKKITLAVDKGQNIVIEADGHDLSDIKVSGSKDTAKLEAYEKFRKESLNRLVVSVRNRLKATGDYNNTESEQKGIDEVTNYEKHKAELNDFIKNNMVDSIAIYPTSLRWDGKKNFTLFKAWVDTFEMKHGDLEITRRIKEKVELLKKTNIGGKLIATEMPDKDGNPIKLNPSGAKYTLVDFWASWCGPCRRESKTIGRLYEKYRKEGFDIYSVSLDSDRGKWLAALEQDRRIWTNVSELKGFETSAAFEYGITAIPVKFLINSEGKIVAKNLSGTELKEKIDGFFKK